MVTSSGWVALGDQASECAGYGLRLNMRYLLLYSRQAAAEPFPKMPPRASSEVHGIDEKGYISSAIYPICNLSKHMLSFPSPCSMLLVDVTSSQSAMTECVSTLTLFGPSRPPLKSRLAPRPYPISILIKDKAQRRQSYGNECE